MSGLPYVVKRVKRLTIGLGIFMILAGAFFLVVLGQYAISLLIAGVFILAGLFGVIAGGRMKVPTGPPLGARSGVVVEVRCRSCNALNSEGAQFCSTCGSKL